MKTVTILTTCVLIMSLFYACKNSEAEVKFVQYVDSSREDKSRCSFFIVQNYENDKRTADAIDDFARSFDTSKISLLDNYLLLFFKESKITNMENLKSRPQDFADAWVDDYVAGYTFRYGKIIYHAKFQGYGSERDSSKVEVKDVPPEELNKIFREKTIDSAQ